MNILKFLAVAGLESSMFFTIGQAHDYSLIKISMQIRELKCVGKFCYSVI